MAQHDRRGPSPTVAKHGSLEPVEAATPIWSLRFYQNVQHSISRSLLCVLPYHIWRTFAPVKHHHFFRAKNLITMQPKNFICSCYKHRSTICEFSSKGLQQGEVPTATGCHLASPQSTHLPKDLPIKPHRRHSTLGREIYWRDWYHQISSYISSAINSHHYSSKKSTAQPASAHNITQYFFLYVNPAMPENWLPARRLRVSSLGQADPGELKSIIHWFHWQNLSVASTWSTW